MLKLFNKTYESQDKAYPKRTATGTVTLLLCISIAIFYIPLVINLLQAKNLFGNAMPSEFNLAAIVIIGSSWMLYQSSLLKEKDKVIPFRIIYATALAMGILFISLQYYGWRYLQGLPTSSSTKIVMVMVFTHAIYFLIGWFMLMLLLARFSKVKTRADCYIFFLDSNNRTGFSTFRMFWDFMALLWLFLYCIMLVKTI
jgi:cytochrome c oxidase subunit 3